jgi:hypothetical protein
MSETRERMLRDVVPAEVVFNDGTLLTKTRVFLTTSRLIIWREVDDDLVAIEKPIRFTDAKASRSTLLPTERLEVFGDDFTAVVNKGRGCACGSKLKGLAPPINWDRKRD